jgi:hypothetical protein
VALGVGLAAGKRQRRPVTKSRSWEHRAPGYREHPPRSGLGRAERGNPVEVRAWPGKPTARKAQPLGGTGWSKKRMPVAERQQETGTTRLLSPVAVSYNWPCDTKSHVVSGYVEGGPKMVT